MSAIIVDSNVILDVFEDDPHWAEWSENQLIHWGDIVPLFINPVIYTEVSIGFKRIEELETALNGCGFQIRQIPKEALFLAGKVFLKYRRKRGGKTAPLSDFYIGAHAAVSQLRLLTRDESRYRTYFPTVELLCPQK